MAASALAMSATGALADYNLTVLHTNDFHARFEPISKYDSGCSSEDNTAGECFGGSTPPTKPLASSTRSAGLRLQPSTSMPALLHTGGDDRAALLERCDRAKAMRIHARKLSRTRHSKWVDGYLCDLPQG